MCINYDNKWTDNNSICCSASQQEASLITQLTATMYVHIVCSVANTAILYCSRRQLFYVHVYRIIHRMQNYLRYADLCTVSNNILFIMNNTKIVITRASYFLHRVVSGKRKSVVVCGACCPGQCDAELVVLVSVMWSLLSWLV